MDEPEGDADAAWAAVDAEVRDAAAALLEVAGAMELDAICDVLADSGALDPYLDSGYEGAELVEVVDEVLAATDEFLHSSDGLLAHAATVLEGLVLTHRVTERELARGALAVNPDLVLVDWDRQEQALVTGGVVRTEFRLSADDDAPGGDHELVGPPGWLDGLADGDLVALRRTDGVELLRLDDEELDAADPAAMATSPTALALDEGFARRTGGDDTLGAEPEWLLVDVLTVDPTLFHEPGPPIGDLFAALDLEIRGSWVGRRGSDWQPPGVRSRELASARLYARYGFDRCCIAAFEEVRSAWLRFFIATATPGHSTEEALSDPRAVAKALAHGAVVPAVADHLFELLPEGHDRIDAFAAALAAAAPGRSAAPAQWLQAKNADYQGRVLDAEALFAAAARSDPDLADAQVELARLASVRGDAVRALSLYAKAGMTEQDPEVGFLRGLVPDTTTVGRNDPCPCGSGRKFKQCHLRGGEPLPLEARVPWLVVKVGDFVRSYGDRRTLIGLVSTAVSAQVDDRDDDATYAASFRELLDDPFLVSVAAVEGGGLAAFLVRRGELLPPDEREIAYEWFEAARRLWEVTAVDAGASLRLRDTATGDEVTVVEQSGSGAASVGQYLLAVAVPVGTAHQLVGTVLDIPLRLRSSVLSLLDADPGADEVADWYGWSLQPPTLTNREGEPTLFRAARLTPTLGWDELSVALDAAFDVSEPGSRWVEHHQLETEGGHDDGEVVVRAFLRRDGDALLVETNSQARFDRVCATLRSIDPEVLVDEMSADDEAGDEDAWADWLPLGAVAGAEVDQLLADRMLEEETRWLDLPVPALDGATPREAADDPTRREDLEALLRSFDRRVVPAGAVSFDPDRIRRALGLDGGA